ncbi:hypothetical protein CW304_30845 [Bacillus sp. UFRGS-B20]|nr:hypothetical protein CW304_30845 [Bacillus sp. UFRGS-B20]
MLWHCKHSKSPVRVLLKIGGRVLSSIIFDLACTNIHAPIIPVLPCVLLKAEFHRCASAIYRSKYFYPLRRSFALRFFTFKSFGERLLSSINCIQLLRA